MRINGSPWRSIFPDPDAPGSVRIIDQTRLPWEFVTSRLARLDDAAHAIRVMQVRGAPLIGATAAYGLALAMREAATDAALDAAAATLAATRPTAVNLRWALDRMAARLRPLPPAARAEAAWTAAGGLAESDVVCNQAIGRHGLPLIAEAARAHPGRAVNILTHCNAGWIATVDWGTALAPIYLAHDSGIAVHVWVDETRPRNQGAALTAWELGAHGVAHTVIADNAGGHLMQRGQVDLVIVGADRVTRTGDVANKIGTYLKALAADDNRVPFWVAVPGSTIDHRLSDGVAEIPIEERDPAEVAFLAGPDAAGALRRIRVIPPGSAAANPAFDVTPARLVRGLITERGCCAASAEGIAGLFPSPS